ncbi:MAG: DNA methylase [Phycisphaerae bacterium]
MAESPSHRFGQIIGEVLETAIRPIVEGVAKEHGLYLDAKRPRNARGGKSKVAWVDGRGNTHDLDYVIEAGGTEDVVGAPKAFVEIAWRRYTKHSRNKAQEIQGAIMPLAERYGDSHPFLGVVLAGVFTDGSLNQLRSLGFNIVYFPYESVVAAFAAVGIDAAFDEDTPDVHLKRNVTQYGKLKAAEREQIGAFLRDRHRADLATFSKALRTTLTRKIASVYVLPLHGSTRTLGDVAEAIAFIESFDESKPCEPFTRYEVGVRYSNGDEIRGQFMDKATAVAFLRSMR